MWSGNDEALAGTISRLAMVVPGLSRNMNLQRAWFYFRTGHGAYLSLIIGLANFVTIQYLAFRDLRVLGPYLFSLIFLPIYALVSILAGWWHRKRQMPIEQSLGSISNPYAYRIQPGKEEQLMVPLTEFHLELSRLMMDKMGLLTPEIEQGFRTFQNRLQRLRNGDELR